MIENDGVTRLEGMGQRGGRLSRGIADETRMQGGWMCERGRERGGAHAFGRRLGNAGEIVRGKWRQRNTVRDE